MSIAKLYYGIQTRVRLARMGEHRLPHSTSDHAQMCCSILLGIEGEMRWDVEGRAKILDSVQTNQVLEWLLKL